MRQGTAPPVEIRRAAPADLAMLAAIEARAFVGDRLSRRSLGRLVRGGRAIVLVAVAEARLVGYALVLLRRGSRVARLYSLARDPATAGRIGGIGGALLAAAELAARTAGASEMRLEVRADNAAASRLYSARGYAVFKTVTGYYEDQADALRMRKSLLSASP
jgi:ribosomal protein S18 acetylase RimI-like enzyme